MVDSSEMTSDQSRAVLTDGQATMSVARSISKPVLLTPGRPDHTAVTTHSATDDGI